MEHTKACVQGNWVACPVCRQEYASALVMCQHHHAKHGADAAGSPGWVCLSILWESFSSKENMAGAQAILFR